MLNFALFFYNNLYTYTFYDEALLKISFKHYYDELQSS